MVNEEVLDTFIEVNPLSSDEFYKVRETLTRIGLPSKADGNGKQTLWQSCHVFQKRDRYYICHFKQMFLLDGRDDSTNFTEEDERRLHYVVNLLEEWELVRCVDEPPEKASVNLVVIPYAEKQDWNLKAKYTIGSKRKSSRNNF